MKKSLTLTLVIATSMFALAVGQAGATAKHAVALKTVTVVMHDPGCHWFSTANKFTTKLSVKGPVALLNLDEAALKIVGPAGVKREAIGKKLVLTRGSYRITMVGQESDDNTLTLRVR